MIFELSADMGEGAADEEPLWPLLDAANIACGGHAGDVTTITHAVARAREHGVILGAHPSYPDRESFGRRSMTMTADALHATLFEQIRALYALGPLRRVKPHGALYNDAHHDAVLARTIIEAIVSVDPTLSIVAPNDSQMAHAARTASVPVIREAFADRRYNPDGSLVSRNEPGSLLTVEESVDQTQLLATESTVIATNGTRISIAFDTICLHSDLPGALARATAISQLRKKKR
ncbi:MAG TPA: 5-oxoprolinase subunit PxpA [Thermoanaerobaculia bacterium]